MRRNSGGMAGYEAVAAGGASAIRMDGRWRLAVSGGGVRIWGVIIISVRCFFFPAVTRAFIPGTSGAGVVRAYWQSTRRVAACRCVCAHTRTCVAHALAPGMMCFRLWLPPCVLSGPWRDLPTFYLLRLAIRVLYLAGCCRWSVARAKSAAAPGYTACLSAFALFPHATCAAACLFSLPSPSLKPFVTSTLRVFDIWADRRPGLLRRCVVACTAAGDTLYLSMRRAACVSARFAPRHATMASRHLRPSFLSYYHHALPFFFLCCSFSVALYPHAPTVGGIDR
jgi:hypothetical protein